MFHRKSHRRLNRTVSHRKALFANMMAALIKHEQIVTTLPKAKELRRVIEPMVTLAKKGGLANRRMAISDVRDIEQVAKLFDVLGPRYAERNGGYTRVLKAGFRHGDAAPMAVIEFVDRDISAKGKDSGPVANENAETEMEDFGVATEKAREEHKNEQKAKAPKAPKAKVEKDAAPKVKKTGAKPARKATTV